MTKNVLGKLVLSALVATAFGAPAAQAMDYEAKPVMWVLQAPFRTVGALSGAAVSGLVSGPIDDGYHWGNKGNRMWSEKFGDEHGWGQRTAAVPLGNGGGMVVGGAHGVYSGFGHGFKKGWEKPFSRWSFITMEEK